jgi:hypothetical protein
VVLLYKLAKNIATNKTMKEQKKQYISIPQSISSGNPRHTALVQGKHQAWQVVTPKEVHHILDRPVKMNHAD